MKPEQIKPGVKVIYHPSPSLSFPATVRTEPWQLSGGTWVCHLTDLPPEYAIATGKTGSRTEVHAAAIDRLDSYERELSR